MTNNQDRNAEIQNVCHLYQPGIPFQAPPVPQHFVPRPQYADRVRKQLLDSDTSPSETFLACAIQGLGGTGKSLLVAALVREKAVRDQFPDGVLWITLGQEPDLLTLLGSLIYELGDREYHPTTINAASLHLQSLLVHKTMLLVVDDLWNAAHFEPFRLSGNSCRVLVTTQKVQLAKAQHCELGVFSLNESVQLVEQYLDHTLVNSERAAFEEFAEIVGYLPLALELAAVQIKDGYNWPMLLSDLREELDVLGIHPSEGSETTRCNLSLRACFNLSLKRLDIEQLRQFAWLGISQKDVSVDARMAATLWDVEPVFARKGLSEFCRRGLLSPGVAVLLDSQPEATFRQHNLLHDFAQELVIASRDSVLPGLGLSVEAAHGELLERYRPESGNWWDLADNGYIHRHLTWHLEQAGQIREIQNLLRAANGAGRNAWWEACKNLGLLAVFVADVARAWRCSEEMYGVIPTEAEGWKWQFWCAFTVSTLHYFASDLPKSDLEKELERHGTRDEFQLNKYDSIAQTKILAVLFQGNDLLFGNVFQRAMSQNLPKSAIEEIIMNSPPSLYLEAIKLSQLITSRKYQITVLADFFKKMPDEFIDKIYLFTLGLSDISEKAIFFVVLAEKDLKFIDEALSLVRMVQDSYKRANCLISLASIDSSIVLEALHEAQKIDYNPWRAELLTELAILDSELIPEALQAIEDVHKPCFSEGIYYYDGSQESSPYYLVKLAKHYPNFIDQALTSIQEMSFVHQDIKASLLMDLALLQPHLFFESIQESIASSNFEIVGVVNYQGDISALSREILAKSIQLICGLKLVEERTVGIASLARQLPLELKVDLLKAAFEFAHPYHRAEALTGFTDLASWQTLATENQNLLRLLSNRERKHLINLLPELHPTLLQLGGQPAIDAAIDAMRDACNQWP